MSGRGPGVCRGGGLAAVAKCLLLLRIVLLWFWLRLQQQLPSVHLPA